MASLPSRSLLLRLGFQAAVSVAFVTLGLITVDIGELVEVARGIDARWLAVALPLFTFAKFIDSVRWRYLLRGVGRPPQRGLFAAFLIGNMVNTLLPLRAGDVAKIQVLATRYGLSRTGVASSVFLVEAVLDGVVFLIFVAVGIAFLDLERVEGVSGMLVFAVGIVAVVALTGAVLLRHRGSRLPVPERLHGHLDRLEEGLDALGSLPRAAGAVSLSLPAWLLEAGTFYLMGQAFGLDVGYPVFLAAMVAANLATAIPFGLWNVGPYEVLVSGVLVAAGVGGEVALGYAVTVHLAVNLWINVVGLVAFWLAGIQPRDLLSTRTAT